MRIVILLAAFYLFSNHHIKAQANNDSPGPKPRWEVMASWGGFADLYYLNIFVNPDARVDFSSYKNQGKKLIFFGKVDRLELMRRMKNERSAFSLTFRNALFQMPYGSGNDELEVWRHTKRFIKRIQFAGNYYRLYHTSEHTEWKVGLGFMVSGEKNGNPVYRLDANRTAEIGMLGNFYWWDPCVPLNVHYLYKPSRLLTIGAGFYTYYVWQIGLEGAAIEAIVAVHF